MDCGTPGFPIPYNLLGFAQVPVHCISDIIQPSQPLSSPSPSAFNLSQHHYLFQLFTVGGQSIGDSASPSVLLMNIQGWFPLRLTGLISLLSKGISIVFSSTTIGKHQFFSSAFFMVHLSQPCMTTGKTMTLTIQTFVGKVMSLFFNTLSRFVIIFLTRSTHLLISSLQSPFAVILGPKKRKFVTVSTISHSICHEVMGLDAMILHFVLNI